MQVAQSSIISLWFKGKELAFGFLSEHVYNNISKVEAEANSDMIWDEMHKLILEADIKG